MLIWAIILDYYKILKKLIFFNVKMSNKKNRYEQDKEKMKESVWNHYHSSNGKIIGKNFFYENNKEKLQKQAWNWYKNISEEEEKKRRIQKK